MGYSKFLPVRTKNLFINVFEARYKALVYICEEEEG
jgi:hypothetical protein